MTTSDLIALLNLSALSNKDADQVVYSWRQVVSSLTAEADNVNNATIRAVWHLEGRITNIVCLSTEDCAKQALFCGQSSLTLRSDLTNQNIARANLSADADDTVIVEVCEHVLTKVWNLAGNLLSTKLGITSINLVAGNVNGGQKVFLNNTLGDDNTVLVVVAFPWHVSNGKVCTKCQLRVVNRWTVCDWLAFLDLLSNSDDWTMVDASGLVGALVLRKIVALRTVLIGVDDNVSCINLGDLAGKLCTNKLTRVLSCAALHTSSNKWSVGLNQGHCLTLHVCTHEGTLCIVMLKEWNEVSCDGEKLTWRNVHVVNVLNRNLCRCTEGTVEVTGTCDNAVCNNNLAVCVNLNKLLRLRVNWGVSRSNNVILLLVCSHPHDVVRNNAVCDLTIRSLDKAVLIYMSVQCQGADKTNVWSLRSLDWTHTGVVRVVNVADCSRNVGTTAGAGLVSCKTARSQSRKTTLVSQTSKWVCLVHELRKLRRTEELLDCSNNWTDVDQRLWSDVVCVLRCHTLTNNTLHAAHTNAELVLYQLANGTDAAVAKVVNVIKVLRLIICMNSKKVLKSCDNVLFGKDTNVCRNLFLKLLVDLVTTNASKVIALLVEEEAVKQRTGRVNSWWLAWTLTTINLDKSILTCGCNVTLKCVANNIGITKEREDLVIGNSNAKCTEEDGSALATLAVNGDDQVAALINLKLKPCTTCRNELRLVDQNTVVHL